jgi:hypothetical protein
MIPEQQVDEVSYLMSMPVDILKVITDVRFLKTYVRDREI